MAAFLIALGTSLVINSLFFAVAASRRTDVVTDLSYSLSFLAVAVILVLSFGAWTPLRLAAAAMAAAWAIRLAAYLFRRILVIKVDHRFDGMRDKPLAFARFWALQATSVALVMLPVEAVLHRPEPGLSPLHAAGAAVWLAGLVVESVADAQKAAWKGSGKPGFIDRGLWAWSRHPNYFGEILVWWGLWLYALPSLSGAWHLAVLGPVFITALLLFVSGLPPLERAAALKWGDDPRYQAYKARTSILVPLPPRAGQRRGPDS